MKIINPTDLSYIDIMTQCQIAMAKETENFQLDPKTVAAGMQAVIEDPSKGKYYLAFNDNDEFMGMLLTIPEWSDWRCAEVLWIHSVYILPEFRQNGIYKKLYLHLQNIVKENPANAGLRLYVDKTNAKAINVYQKLGMSDDHYSLFEWLK